MDKKTSRQDLFEILRRFHQGASIEDILLAFTPKPKKTVQHYLARLVQEGHIEALRALYR